ncbi:hypothetical protein NDU88_006551 [Pleurodeles waltl]|uniref:Reverse transcriptase zinc-binding domain-containing protein n=1 Tax=Pleurodeles waltl TaxID=8319 RepID=A0AAV7VPZ6_PLEWA|nr:hypothetical protein NDU88_006551 [Pleurodeles waltl]
MRQRVCSRGEVSVKVVQCRVLVSWGDKVQLLIELLEEAVQKPKLELRKVQRLLGHLNFACKVILLHSGAQLNDDLVRRWELAGFSKIGDFHAKDNWETPLNILTIVKNDFLLAGSYNILLHILRDLVVNSIANVQSLVTELVDPPGTRTAGSWRRILADMDKADLGTKAWRKWARQEGLEVSSDCWETINRLNFTILRGANWHRMIFFCKWLLYRTPQDLSRMGTGYPDMCFRCKEIGVAGWIHMIATCRCKKGYWGGNFCDVNNYGAGIHISQHTVNELGLRS